jgi:hypothetical protein
MTREIGDIGGFVCGRAVPATLHHPKLHRRVQREYVPQIAWVRRLPLRQCGQELAVVAHSTRLAAWGQSSGAAILVGNLYGPFQRACDITINPLKIR